MKFFNSEVLMRHGFRSFSSAQGRVESSILALTVIVVAVSAITAVLIGESGFQVKDTPSHIQHKINITAPGIISDTSIISNDTIVQPMDTSGEKVQSTQAEALQPETKLDIATSPVQQNPVQDQTLFQPRLAKISMSVSDRAKAELQNLNTRETTVNEDVEDAGNNPSPEARQQRISGRVSNSGGVPLPGVIMVARPQSITERSPDRTSTTPLSELQAVTDQHGKYAFRGLQTGEYVIRVLGTTTYMPTQKIVRTGVDYANFVLDSFTPVAVHGVVHGPGGDPLLNVHVLPLAKGIQRGTTTDEEGRFYLKLASDAKSSLRLRFHQPDYRTTNITVDTSNYDAGKGLDITLTPLYVQIPVAGRVTSQYEAVAAETVQLFSPSLNQSYINVTDEVGNFYFSGVDAADDYRLSIQPRGAYQDFSLKKLDLTIQSTYLEIDLEPNERGPRLAGRMVDASGSPIPGITLMARSARTTNQAQQVSGDGQGRYQIDNAPIGELVFENRSMPFHTISGIHISNQDQQGQEEIPLILDWGEYALRGRVVDGHDQPVSTPKIHLTWSHTDKNIRSRSSRTSTADSTGRFAFTDLGPGPHTLIVNAPGFKGARLREVSTQGGEVVVRLEPQPPKYLETSL